MWRHNSTSKPPSWKKTVQVTQYKKSSLFFLPRAYIDDNRRAWPPIRIFVCLILLLFVTWLLLWWVNLSVERHFYPSRRNRQRYKRSNSQHLGRNKKRISGETLYSLITSTVCVCIIVWKGFLLLFFKEKKKSISSGSQKFSNVFFLLAHTAHTNLYKIYRPVSVILLLYSRNEKDDSQKNVHSFPICHFLVLWMKPKAVQIYITFPMLRWGIHQCFISADIRLSVSNAYSSMVGGKSRREGVPVKRSSWSNTRKVLHRRDSLFWRVWKGPKKKWEEKPLAGFSSTQRIKRLQSHTEVNGWVTWMKTRVLPLWELDIYIRPPWYGSLGQT